VKWNLYKLISIGSLGALWAISNILGAAVSAITGILGAGGLINTFFGGMLLAFCCLLVRKFGSATIAAFVFSIIALPLPVLGTPGFFPKLIIGISTGLICDIIYLLLKKNERISAVAVGVGQEVVIAFEVVGFGLLFSIPGIEKAAKLLFSTPAIFILSLIGGIGGYVGYIAFNKLRNTAVVRRIQG